MSTPGCDRLPTMPAGGGTPLEGRCGTGSPPPGRLQPSPRPFRVVDAGADPRRVGLEHQREAAAPAIELPWPFESAVSREVPPVSPLSGLVRGVRRRIPRPAGQAPALASRDGRAVETERLGSEKPAPRSPRRTPVRSQAETGRGSDGRPHVGDRHIGAVRLAAVNYLDPFDVDVEGDRGHLGAGAGRERPRASLTLTLDDNQRPAVIRSATAIAPPRPAQDRCGKTWGSTGATVSTNGDPPRFRA